MNNHSIGYPNNTLICRLDELQDEDGSYVNNATVVLDSFVDARTGVAVSGVTAGATLAYVSGSNGRYELTISAAAEVVVDRTYIATVTATDTESRQAQYSERIRITTRRS